MRPHRHRRALFNPDCYEHGWYACPPPPWFPSSPDSGPGPTPSPSPSAAPPPAGIPWLCPPVSPPAPAPAHSGRRDQGGGMQGYGPPPPGVGGAGGGHDRRHLVKYVLVAGAVIAFVSLILLGVYVAVRRRHVRRRRQALLAPSINANVDDGGGGHDHGWGGDGGGGGGGGGGVVHHVWNIRTVGLDEASIASIAVTRYRAGAGLLGAADCSVCLGEFQDGELVRLLPKCAHAFHAPCIDTWLRARVTCPICRSDVLDDPAVTADSGGGGGGSESVGSSSTPPADPDGNASAAADQAGAASDVAPVHHEDEESDGRDISPAELNQNQPEQSSSAEPPPLPPPQILCSLPRNVRRAASMDAVVVSTAADDVAELDRLPEEAPEEEQIGGGRRKRCTGPSRAKASGSGHWSSLSTERLAPGGVPRSFFSRHSRARSSVLPL